VTDSPVGEHLTFSRFTEHARSTEVTPEFIKADADYLRRLMEFMLSASALIDLYKQALYNERTIPVQSFEARLEQLRKSSSALQIVPSSSRYISGKHARLFLALTGIFTEAGELFESMHPENETIAFDTVCLLEELGDLNWYQSIALDDLKTPLEAILRMNVAKLGERFDGKSGLEPEHRDKDTERIAMIAANPQAAADEPQE
jgi:NTP pyrophosphatase (non-canonical NTP hydrolase)